MSYNNEIIWKYIDQDKNRENVSKQESVEVVSAHCNLVNSNYQQASKALQYLVLDQIINLVN